MNPRIQYAATSDAVSIAFWTAGDGIPVVLVYPPGYSNIQYEWEIPEIEECYESVAAWAALTRFDIRNTGLSERKVPDVSLDAFVKDLAAVMDRIGFERAHLFAGTDAGKIAIAYAAENPDRVSSLTLFRTNPGPGGSAAAPGWTNLRPLLDTNWELFTDLLATAVVGLADGELTQRMSRYVRESVTPQEFVDASDSLAMADVRPLLPLIKAPTLVLHRMDTPFFQIERARKLVATIPDARLSVIGGKSPFAWDSPVIDATKSFIEEVANSEHRERYGFRGVTAFRTILFTDVEGHVSMMNRLGDVKGRDVLREHERLTREALREHHGSEVKTMGDGFLASFTSAQKALECAGALQRSMAEMRVPDWGADEAPIRIRIGVNAGEPIAEDDDLFGSSVIAAARIAAMAKGGEVLVANVVRELVAGKGFLFNDRGESALRGLEDPVRLWELSWAEAQSG